MNIPIELIEQIEKGGCALFLGRQEVDPAGTDSGSGLNEMTLARRLASRVQYPEPFGPLYEVAEYFQVERERQALIQYVCDVVEEYSHQYPRYYDTLVGLPFNIIVTTSLDNSLERVLQTRGRKFVKIVRDEEITFIPDDKLLVVKLYGDVDNKASIVITKEDHIAFFDQLPNISDLLKFYFSTKTLVFVGYDLNNPQFLRFYAHANQRTKNYQRRAYAIKPNATSHEIRMWEKRNLTLLDLSPSDFFSEIASRLLHVTVLPPKDQILTVMPEAALVAETHRSPYKFLSSFEEQDFDIFFGRDQDVVLASRVLLPSKLTILYGKSGFGKTSLIRAGIMPRLLRNGYLPVYARCAGDPLTSVKANVIDRMARPVRTGVSVEKKQRLSTMSEGSLLNFTQEYGKIDQRPLVVFIDQFEEFFISLGAETRKQFESQLAECVDSPYTSATFVLALREDFLPELHDLHDLRSVSRPFYRVKALTSDQAGLAIAKPAEKFGITYESGLVELIIQQLSDREQVDPAQLQIVCDRLYNSLPEHTSRVSRALFDELGGVKQILADYVDAILDSLGSRRRHVAQRLLRGMVTSVYTKTMLSYSDALLESKGVPEWSEADTRGLLNDLVHVRLIRRVADIEDETYELTHEYLINKIREWIDLETLKVKEAQDLLRQEYNNWLRHKIPMDRSALRIVDAQRERLVLNNKLNAFILLAATRYDADLDYWVGRNIGNAEAIDLQMWTLREGGPEAKRLAGVAIGFLTKEQAVIDEVFRTFETLANPNTIGRIEELLASGFSAFEGFLDRVREIVKCRFTRNMAFVEAGEFLMGAHLDEIESIAEANQVPMTFFEGQYPIREIYVGAFYIDRFLVTNAEFQEFKPTHIFPEGHEQHPATNVSYSEAEQFARWVGKEIPTEEEWEKAARGIDGRRFPWGDEWDPSRCNTRLSGYGGTTPVDSFPTGISPYGCHDMAGNVWKWTSTWLHGDRKQKVLRGGSWSKYGILPWCFYRFNYEPESGYSNVGFVCVKRADRLSEGTVSGDTNRQ